jgi:hypothetical protein
VQSHRLRGPCAPGGRPVAASDGGEEVSPVIEIGGGKEGRGGAAPVLCWIRSEGGERGGSGDTPTCDRLMARFLGMSIYTYVCF